MKVAFLKKVLPVNIGPRIDATGIDEYVMATSFGFTIFLERRVAYGSDVLHTTKKKCHYINWIIIIV